LFSDLTGDLKFRRFEEIGEISFLLKESLCLPLGGEMLEYED